jgi:Flp pilus assembly protein TadD
MEPGHATALGVRALGLLDAGHLPAAQAAATDCLVLYPDQHEALLASATVHLWTGNPALAGEQYQRALMRFPNSGRALSGMGQVLAMAGQLEQAEATLRHAVRTMPDHIGTWHALGWVQLLQGELPAARNSYQAAYDLDRNFAESHGGLAVVAFFEECFEEGEAGMKRALKLDPNCVSGRYAKTLWLHHTGQAEASDVLFAELMEQGALPGIDRLQASQAAARLRARATSQRPQG